VRHLDRFALDASQRQGFIAAWRQMLTAPQISTALQRSTYDEGGRSVELYRELPFVSRDGQQLLRGAIDRVVVARRGSAIAQVVIIDYKTDRIDPLQVAERTEVYRPQLEVYIKAVQRMFGVASSQVKAQLLFTRIGKAQEL